MDVLRVTFIVIFDATFWLTRLFLAGAFHALYFLVLLLEHVYLQ